MAASGTPSGGPSIPYSGETSTSATSSPSSASVPISAARACWTLAVAPGPTASRGAGGHRRGCGRRHDRPRPERQPGTRSPGGLRVHPLTVSPGDAAAGSATDLRLRHRPGRDGLRRRCHRFPSERPAAHHRGALPLLPWPALASRTAQTLPLSPAPATRRVYLRRSYHPPGVRRGGVWLGGHPAAGPLRHLLPGQRAAVTTDSRWRVSAG